MGEGLCHSPKHVGTSPKSRPSGLADLQQYFICNMYMVVYVHVHVDTDVYGMYVCVCVCMFVCICMYVSMYAWVRVCTCMYVFTHKHQPDVPAFSALWSTTGSVTRRSASEDIASLAKKSRATDSMVYKNSERWHGTTRAQSNAFMHNGLHVNWAHGPAAQPRSPPPWACQTGTTAFLLHT